MAQSGVTTKQITVRLPTARVDDLRSVAKSAHRSLAAEVEHRLSNNIGDVIPEDIARAVSARFPLRTPVSEAIVAILRTALRVPGGPVSVP